MSTYEKLLRMLMEGEQDNNFKFRDLQKVLNYNDFVCRIKGDHYIFTRRDLEEIINIQPDGNKAKAYQVKQIRNIFLKYRIGGVWHA